MTEQYGIGSSLIAGIAGASPWASMTPVAIWLRLMRLAPPQLDTASMSAGRALEKTIVDLTAAELGVRITRNRQRFFHPEYPRVPLWATPDGFTPHRRQVVEVKLVSHRFADWSDGVPDYVNLQVQGQLACYPRAERAIVGALIGGDLRTYQVERDDELQRQLPELVRDWYETHVVGELAPDPAGPGDRWALVRVRAASSSARQERLATDVESRVGAELGVLLSQRDALDAQIDERRVQLAEASSDHDLVGVGWRARWSQRSSTDWSALIDELGVSKDVVDRFTSSTSTFTFRRSKVAQSDDQVSIDIVGLVPAGTFR